MATCKECILKEGHLTFNLSLQPDYETTPQGLHVWPSHFLTANVNKKPRKFSCLKISLCFWPLSGRKDKILETTGNTDEHHCSCDLT